MGKIGILTFHRSYNYGAFMQCYSLVKKLQNDFPNRSIEVIDYTTESIIKLYRSSQNNILRNIRHPFLKSKIKRRNKCFKNAQSFLPLSEYSLTSDDYFPLFERIKGKYDAIIVGSDAVWNWVVRGFPNAYFLNADLGAPKLSFAASSHGMDYMQVTSEQHEYLERAWFDFSYIGVRDSATEGFINSVNKKIGFEHNCDPTVFLDLDSLKVDMEILRNKLIQSGINLSKPIIGLMGNNWLGKHIRELYGDKYQIVAVYEPNIYADAYIFELSPFEWAKIFSLFSLTFTQYFHGTLLSLKNSTPVIPIDINNYYSKKYDTKIKDLLKRLNLLDCYFTESSLNEIEWGKVKEKANELLSYTNKDTIQRAINLEAENYCTFKQTLEKTLLERV